MRLPETSSRVRLKPEPVPLEPFGHQVAGRSSMLMLDPHTLCKPLIPREHQLYLTLPPSLRPFTPHFAGVLYVRLEEGEDGSLNLWGYYPDTDLDPDPNPNPSPPWHLVDNAQAPLPTSSSPRSHHAGKNQEENSNISEPPEPDTTTGSEKVNNNRSGRETAEDVIVDNQKKKSLTSSTTKATTTFQPPNRLADNNKSKVHRRPVEQSITRKSDSLSSNSNSWFSGKECVGVVEDKSTEPSRDEAMKQAEDGGGGMVGEEVEGWALTSGFSSCVSTPMSSSSEQDLTSSALDHAPFPSRPSSRCVVRLTEDGEYKVTGGQGAHSRFLVAPDDQALAQTNADPNPDLGQKVTTQPLNPWGFNLHTRLLDKMRKSQPSSSGCPFLVLENMVARFSRPCILDLKVGSRLHGDDASPKKMASQSCKCNMTTSRSLGLRLCGMQVYQETTGAYKSLDKYHGRTLTDATFYEVLRDFLHNGREMRCELLSPILSRLHVLIDSLNELHSFRFYASSLLIMYDGLCSSPSSSPASPTAELNLKAPAPKGVAKMETKKTEHGLEYDKDGREKGKHRPRVSVGQNLSQNVDKETERELLPSSSRMTDDDPGPHRKESSQQHSKQCASTLVGVLNKDGAGRDSIPERESSLKENPSRLDMLDSPCKVDVRMIDFAHTTHSGLHDSVLHEGPDRDYILGLNNLTAMFTSLYKEYY